MQCIIFLLFGSIPNENDALHELLVSSLEYSLAVAAAGLALALASMPAAALAPRLSPSRASPFYHSSKSIYFESILEIIIF